MLLSVRMAGMLTDGLLVGNYLLMGLSNLNQDLKAFVQYTPLHYYQSGEAIDGLDWVWLAGVVGVSVVFVLLAWWRFQQRDIRVGSQGGWNLPSLSRVFRRGQPAQ